MWERGRYQQIKKNPHLHHGSIKAEIPSQNKEIFG